MGDVGATNTSRLRLFVGAVLLLTVMVAVMSARSDSAAATPRVIEGWAMPNIAGTAISLHASASVTDENSGDGFIVAGASWAGPDGVWHDGTDLPTCIGTDPGSFTHVRLGVIDVRGGEAPSGPRIVWLRCLARAD